MDVELSSQTTLEQLVANILEARRITRQDQQRLMALFGQNNLNSQEQGLINHLYETLRRGLLRVVD